MSTKPDELPKRKVLLVDSRRYAKKPAQWWTWLGVPYQAFFSCDLDHAVAQCKSVAPELVVIGFLGDNEESFAAAVKSEGISHVGLIDTRDNPMTSEILLSLVEAAMKKKTILIVGGDALMTWTLRRILEAKYEIREASNVELAEHIREQSSADLVIIDDVDHGAAYARDTYAAGRQEVLITGQFSGAGAVPRLRKPFLADELLGAVRERLSQN